MLIEAGVFGAATAVAAAAWAVRGKSSQVFGPSIWHGDRSRKAIALTFDDGPSESTEEVLDLLHKHGAKATFFQCGMNADRLPKIARAVSDAGHAIGNHTYSHPKFWLMSPRFINEEIRRAQLALRLIHRTRPQWFRAPYGVRWFGLAEAQKDNGLTGVMWTTVARDWSQPADQIVKRCKAGTANGAILCFHDGRGVAARPDIRPTVAALRALLPWWKDQGYAFAAIEEVRGGTTIP